MKVKITSGDIVNKVREIVLKRPQIKYNRPTDGYPGGCYYEKGICTDNSVGCLFGQALTELGYDVSINILKDYIDIEMTTICDNCSDDDLKWCRNVQKLQDVGHPWEIAVQLADEDTKE